MSAQPPVRRYDDGEVARILRQAARGQRDAEVRAGGLTLAELEQVAREAGIDPALVRQAASDVETTRAGGARIFGAPIVARVERLVPGTLEPGELEAIVDEIRRTFYDAGQVSSVGQAFGWTATPPRRASVTIAPVEGGLLVRADESLAQQAGGLFGGLVGGLGGGGTGVALGVGLGVFGSVLAGVGVAAAALGGSYVLARTIFSRLVGRRRYQLASLVERIAARVRVEGTHPTLPAPGSAPASQLPSEI